MTNSNHGPGICMTTWQKNRTLMFINFSLSSFIYGLSITGYYPTEYYYFKNFMKLEKADLYYGLSWVFLYSSGVICSFIGSYYADKTKNVRTIFMVVNVMNIVGNVLYCLYYSPYVVLFGQLLIGSVSARAVAAVGEISRVYSASELTQKMFVLSIFSTIGSLFGPATAYFFIYIDIDFNGWKLNIGNMIGVLMFILNVIHFFLSYFTLNNVSKEYTLKERNNEFNFLNEANEVTQEDECEENESENERKNLVNIKSSNEDSFTKDYISGIKLFMKNKNVVFLLFLCFFTSFIRGLIQLLVPAKASNYLQWKQTQLATVMITSSCAGAIPMALLLSIISKWVNDFWLYLISLVVLILPLIAMPLLPSEASKNYEVAEGIVYISILAISISAPIFHVLSRSMLAKFVPENVQTVGEAVRNALFEFAYLLDGSLFELASYYMVHTLLVILVILVVSLILYMLQCDVFMKIKTLQMDDECKVLIN